MASFATTIHEFSDSANSRTYEIDGHTVQAPKLLIQKRKVPTSASGTSSSSMMVVYGTEDDGGNPLQSKVAFGADVRYPVNGQTTDIAAALAVFRDFVASDEFTAMVNSQSYFQ